jgi:glycosyltransferase involved in cell wall biosynthesis
MFGYLEMDELVRLIKSSDICVNLRYPTLGEMSGIIPKIMALGKPLIVTDIDSFSELPDNACFKVKVGAGEDVEIASIFSQLAENPDVVKKMGEEAITYVKECSWEKTAERYRDFIMKLI